MQPIEARRSQAGSPMRCPWCHASQTVPQESREEIKADEYPLRAAEAEAARQSAAAPETYLPVVCGLCHTRMYATPEQVGQNLICPDCGTATAVRPAAPTRKPAAEKLKEAAAEIYNVLEGSDQPPPTAKTVYGKYIRVICGACRTRMLATEEQVGQELVCPDCGMTTRVPAPAEALDLDRPDVTKAGEYGLGSTDQPQPGSAALREHFRYVCPVCSTHLQATREEAGHQTRCPDCLTTFAIPEPPAKSRPVRGEDEAVESYGTSGATFEAPPVLISGFAPVVRGEPLRRLSEEEMEERGDGFLHRREAAPLPRWPFVKGVFDFPFRFSSLPCWLGLTAFGTLIALISGMTYFFTLNEGQTLFLQIFLGGLTTVLGFMWLLWMSSACLMIVVDTAGGIEPIDNWRRDNFLDRAFDFVYLLSAYGWGGLIGLILDSVLVACGLPQGSGVFLGVFMVPPIALLGLLETGSWLNPFSLPLWSTLVAGWRGWGMFYLMAALLDAAVFLLAIGLDYLIGPVSYFFVPVVLVTWCMIYFRLLGRLGLCCIHQVSQDQQRPSA
jgi:DNA-directed RNA polymerase subunit M/transcription elongation factor TFIIS